MKDFCKTLLPLISMTLLIGCGGGTGDSLDLSSGSGGGGTSGGQGDSSGFWIDIADRIGKFEVHESEGTSFGQECIIAPTETSNSATQCYFDILELDNYAQSVDIQWNVPADMCDYVVVQPSWHWNYSSGNGPKEIIIQKNAEGQMIQIPPRTDGGCSARKEDNTLEACTANLEVSEISAAGDVTCVYDESGTDNGQNCCFGQYTLTVETDTNGNNAIDAGETSTTTEEWGGRAENCIGGAVVTGGWETNKDSGLPIGLLYNVSSDGRNDVIAAPANSQTLVNSFQYALNHYTTSLSPHSHDGYVSTTTSTTPYAFTPIDDLDGSAVTSGRVPHIITCIDNGDEVKHQFEIYIQEWNTYSEWLLKKSSLGVEGNPDLTGVEGGGGANDCPYESGFGTNPCNDFTDWDDLLTGVGGTYTTTVSIGAPVQRKSYFPNISY